MKPTSKTKSKTITVTRKQSKSGPVALQHQQKIIDFLDNKCKNQHGLILFHQMGTGKTLTSLFYLQASKSTKNLLVCPDELLVVWANEIAKLGLELNKVFELIITYSNINKLNSISDLSKYTMIMDEAHNIIKILNSDKTNARQTINKLQSVNRALLLTGTPVYNNETDILYLFNIAAGKNIVPYQQNKFKEEYFKVKVMDAVVKGWATKMLANNLLGNVLTKVNYASMVTQLTNMFMGEEIIPNYAIQLDKKVLNKSVSLYTPAFEKILKMFNVSLETKMGIMDALPAVAAFLNTSVLGVLSLIAKQHDTYKIEDFYTLDANKYKKIAPYISYFSIDKNSPDFPEVAHITNTIDYTSYQISVWVNTLLGEFNSDINDDNDELFENISSEDDYIMKGRNIGNLSNNGYCPKFLKVLKIIGNSQAVVYSNFYQKGGLSFAKLLEDNQIKYGIINATQSLAEKQKILKQFYEKKIQIVILHPKITEGISILGAAQLHILEPLIEKADKDQLIGRVVRYQSHTHLPKSERKVTIYHWVCKADGALAKFNQKVEIFKNWAKKYKAVPPMYLETKYKKDITPDSIVYERGNKLQTFIENIQRNSKLIPDKCGE